MINIDGSQGEGGGQIFRTALSLSLWTGQSVSIQKIRSRRRKPGLLRQHLTALNAAAEISDGVVDGAVIGSTQVVFSPTKVNGGAYHFSVGTAGSCTLVLQTVLLPLLQADCPSHLVLEGGTHNPMAPPYDFLKKVYIPLLNRMGANISVELERPGFFPAGGGRMHVHISPCERFKRLELHEGGEVVQRRARVLISRVPRTVAERERKCIQKKLTWTEDELSIEVVTNSPGPGNVILLELEREQITEVFTGFGARDRTSEYVAGQAVNALREYLAGGVPVGCHLADQLLLPMAVGCGGVFRTLPLTRHTKTNIDVLRQFMGTDIRITDVIGKVKEVVIDVPK